MDTSKLLKSMQQQATQLVTPTFQRLSSDQDDFIMMRKQEKTLYLFLRLRIFQTAWLFLENSQIQTWPFTLYEYQILFGLLCKLQDKVFSPTATLLFCSRSCQILIMTWTLSRQNLKRSSDRRQTIGGKPTSHPKEVQSQFFFSFLDFMGSFWISVYF